MMSTIIILFSVGKSVIACCWLDFMKIIFGFDVCFALCEKFRVFSRVFDDFISTSFTVYVR